MGVGGVFIVIFVGGSVGAKSVPAGAFVGEGGGGFVWVVGGRVLGVAEGVWSGCVFGLGACLPPTKTHTPEESTDYSVKHQTTTRATPPPPRKNALFQIS